MITILKFNSNDKLLVNEDNVCSIYHNTIEDIAHILYINGRTETVTEVKDIQYDNNK